MSKIPVAVPQILELDKSFHAAILRLRAKESLTQCERRRIDIMLAMVGRPVDFAKAAMETGRDIKTGGTFPQRGRP